MTRLDDLIARAQDLPRLPPPEQLRLAADLLEAGRDEGRATEALQVRHPRGAVAAVGAVGDLLIFRRRGLHGAISW